MSATPWCRVVLGAILLSGCASDRDFRRPDEPLPPAWSLHLATALSPVPADVGWWAEFSDPVLADLLSRALSGSPDLRIAADRVLAAGDAIRVAHSYRYPTLGLIIGPTDPIVDRLADTTRSRSDLNEGYYEMAFDATYEIDLWGRVNSGVKAARAGYEATLFDAGTAQIALRSSVARTYFQLRQVDEQGDLLSKRGELLDEQLRLTQMRASAGRVAGSALTTIQIARKDLSSHLAALRGQRTLLQQGIAVLIGEVPESLDLPPQPLRGRVALAAIPAGLPSSLLEKRPDIRSAEARLAEAEAEIGVARAERFPQVTLTAEFGYLTAAVNQLVHAGSAIFGVGPGLNYTLFDGGRGAAQESARRHQYDAATAEYRKSILAGLADVEKALLEYQGASEAATRTAETAELLRTDQRLLERRIEAGRASRPDILELQMRLLDTEAAAVQAYRDRLDALLALYQALGGGWDASQLPFRTP